MQNKDQLFEKRIFLFQPELLEFICRRTKDYHIAEDLCQETLFRAYQAMDTLHSFKRIKSWVFSIAFHVAVDWLRRKASLNRRFPAVVNTATTNFASTLDHSILEKEAKAIIRQDVDRLWVMANKLPPLYRKVFELRYRKWRPIAKISRMTDLPENNIKVQLFRARRMLQRAIEREGMQRFFHMKRVKPCKPSGKNNQARLKSL